jgi:N-hydroxyarylamine O-acetyltransferase
MNEKELAAYLDRINAERPRSADTAALRALHRAHLLAVPFENLSIHLGEPISLDRDALIDKIVMRRRGGFCYELNGAFALLLGALGFDVELLAARVFGDDSLGPPFDHLALVVRTAGRDGPWLADVGFGSHSVHPLRFGDRGQQDDPGGSFQLADVAAAAGAGCRGDGDIDVIRDGQQQYRLEQRERSLADFGPTCWWQQTSPKSHFTRTTICSRLTADGRVSISGRTLITTRDGTRTEQDLHADAAVLAAYRDHFGIILDRVPAVGSAAP